MRSSSPQVVDVRSIAAGGDGVSSLPDGKVLFVPFTAPGDRVRVQVTEERERWARGELIEVIEPSPQRVDPPCPHFGRCGGCTLQHLSAEGQIEAKRDIIRDSLERIGGVGALDRPEVAALPPRFEYRTRVTFHLLRTPSRAVAGFQRHQRPGYIVSVGEECLLPTPLLRRVWGRLRASWGDHAERLPDGERLRLTLRETGAAPAGVALLVESGDGGPADPGGPAEREILGELLAQIDELDEIRCGGWMLRGAEAADEGGRSTFAFEQVNRSAAELLRARVLDVVGDPAGRRIVDAYCGVGQLGRRLAESGATVTGIELDPEAVGLARQGAPDGFTVREGAVEALLGRELPADLVLLNPPRAGVHEDVTRVLSGADVPGIVYVSCDPATLARDVRRLAPTYRLCSVEGFDLFPQTAHVETLAVLEREPHTPSTDGTRN